MESKLTTLGKRMVIDIFVVCLNRDEYDDFIRACHEDLDKVMGAKIQQVHYVYDAEMLVMPRPARVVLWGRYFRRPDWLEIEHLITHWGHKKLLIR